jgi:hypothetical protein
MFDGLSFVLGLFSIDWNSFIIPIIVIGVVMCFVSQIKLLPIPYRFILGVVGAILSIVGIFVSGMNHQAKKEIAATEQFKLRIAQLELAAQEKKIEIVNKYIDRIKTIEVEKQVYAEAVNEIFTPEIINRFPISNGFVRLHNSSASGSLLPSSAERIDGETSTITIARATEVIVENYTNCRANVIQLEALQDWIQSTQELINK